MSENKIRFDVVYLGVVPIAHQSEGLNVLLSDTIKPLLRRGVDVTIHTTNRHRKSIANALSGNGVDNVDSIIDSYPVGSISLQLLRFFSQRRKDNKKSKESDLLRDLKSVVRRLQFLFELVVFWLCDFSLVNLIYKAPLFLVALGVMFGLLFFGSVAFAFVGIFVFVCYLLISSIKRFSRKIINSRNIFSINLKIYLRRKISHVRKTMVERMYVQEQKRFASAINRRKDIQQVFFFTAFEGDVVERVQHKKVVVFPDAVVLLFPLRFIGHVNRAQIEAIRKSVRSADRVVCYSEFVKNFQLMKFFGKELNGKPVNVIPQGYFRAIDLVTPEVDDLVYKLNLSRNLFVNNFPTLLNSPPKLNFGTFDYIIYPTIDRPHKNTVTLIRSYEILLRRFHLNLKLILTTPNLTSDVFFEIESRRLQYDVLFMPSVPSDVLDLLFRGASLMVHPSLAEGGDIFNFSRAVSVGCPALMANVPVVREMFDRADVDEDVYESWLFEPANAVELAELMSRTLRNRADVQALQAIQLEKLSGYDFDAMAIRYLNFYLEA